MPTPEEPPSSEVFLITPKRLSSASVGRLILCSFTICAAGFISVLIQGCDDECDNPDVVSVIFSLRKNADKSVECWFDGCTNSITIDIVDLNNEPVTSIEFLGPDDRIRVDMGNNQTYIGYLEYCYPRNPSTGQSCSVTTTRSFFSVEECEDAVDIIINCDGVQPSAQPCS